jgi:hypothetical protein
MKMTLTCADIASAFESAYGTRFSHYGALALADHLLELEEALGEEYEFDAMAIRCEFNQYECPQMWAEDYFSGDIWEGMGIDLTGDETEDEQEALIRDYIEDHGTLITFSGGIIVSNF